MERGGVDFSLSDQSEEDQLRKLQWIDEHFPEGFIDWHEYDHPQLGTIEIGGIHSKFTSRNAPPGKWLEAEAERCIKFALGHASMLPRLLISELKTRKISETVFKIEVQIQNTGFMPTYVTQFAVKTKVAKPVIAQIVIPEKAELVSGYEKELLGHLEGRSAKLLKPRVVGGGIIDRTKKSIDWVVKTDGTPQDITIHVRCPRAGRDHKTVSLS